MPLTLALPAMATRFELVLAGGDERELRAAGEEALQEVARVERLISPYRPDSQVAHLLRHGSDWVALDPEVTALLTLCVGLHEVTEGRFDPTLGDGRIEVQDGRARLIGAAPGLDLGAIGKGWAIDLSMGVLRDAGVTCALLHGGTSSVAAIGNPPDSDAWRVSLGTAAETSVRLVDGLALSVSAPRDSSSAGRHVIDPRTGDRAFGRDLAVVVAESAAWADAWSTALLVGGALPAAMASFVVKADGVHSHDPKGVFE